MLFCYCYCFCCCWRGREPGTSEIDSCCLDNCSCYLSPKITFSSLAPFSSTAGNLLYVIEHFLKGQKSELFTRIRMIASYFLSLQAGKCYNELECIGRGGAIKGYCSPRALGVRRRRIWCQLITIDNSQACCVFTASRCNRKVTQVDIIHVWGAPGCGTFCHKQNLCP